MISEMKFPKQKNIYVCVRYYISFLNQEEEKQQQKTIKTPN